LQVHELSPSIAGWCYAEAQGKGPCARSSHRAVAWRDTMLLFGGHSGGSDRLNDLYTLRHTDSGWTWSQDLQPVIGARPVGEQTEELLESKCTKYARADCHFVRRFSLAWQLIWQALQPHGIVC
jgi:hypothetical protein